jgi:hypothetical protein
MVGPRARLEAVAKRKNPCTAGNRTTVVRRKIMALNTLVLQS